MGVDMIREYAAVQISPNMYEDDIGQLICVNAIIAREGEQKYRRSDLPKWDPSKGDYEVTVTRPWKSVSDALAIASFEAKPLIIDHHTVTLDNIKDRQVGYIKDVMVGPKKVNGYNVIVATLVIYDKATIDRVRSGSLRELSCSYDCEIDMDNLEVTQIRGLHVALVPTGRAEIARINDAASTAQHSLIDGNTQNTHYFNTTNGFRNIILTLLSNHKMEDKIVISEIRYDGIKIESFDDLPGTYRGILSSEGFRVNENNELVRINPNINPNITPPPPVPDVTRDTQTATFGDSDTTVVEEESSKSMRAFTVVVYRIGWDNTVRHKLITRFGVNTDVVITKPSINEGINIPNAKHIFKLEAAKIPNTMQVMHEFHKIYSKEIIAKHNFDEYGNAKDHKLIPWGVFQMFFTIEYKITEITLTEDQMLQSDLARDDVDSSVEEETDDYVDETEDYVDEIDQR